jgi:hypothetical protein
MNLALIVITLLSLATTGALLVYVARMLRDERTRTEARVAALASAIRHDEPAGNQLWSAHVAADVDREPALAAPSFVAGSLFAEAAGDSERRVSGRWIAPIVGLAAVAAVVAVTSLTGSDGSTPPPAKVAGTTTVDPPLELLSLRHGREAKSLTISGLVRNPPDASPHARTDVVVFTFDQAGAPVSNVRAALADPALAGGSESPFSVTIPDGSRVNRYRVSFRTGDLVLPHVDRRR